ASVPSAGCLLAKNQYYRSECRDTVVRVYQCLMVWAFSPLAGLPELIDKCWWMKSFFHSEPSPPTVGRKTLSAS
ncbi:Pancreatic progenitor cell differentiation and proliferation factor-like, partial [Cathartes aura]